MKFHNQSKRKLWPDDIEAIRARRRKWPPDTVKSIAADYRVSSTLISRWTRDIGGRKIRSDKKKE